MGRKTGIWRYVPDARGSIFLRVSRFAGLMMVCWIRHTLRDRHSDATRLPAARAGGHHHSGKRWHCDADNVGSWKTAEKAGFVKERDYTLYYCVFSSVHEIAEMGLVAVNARQYQAAVDAYDHFCHQRRAPMLR